MLSRNLLKAGEFIQPVPIGVRITLQYKPTGILEKVWMGYGEIARNLSSKSSDIEKHLYSEIVKQSKVPTRINTNTGYVFVHGVLYTSQHPIALGYFDDDLQLTIAESITAHGRNFNFFAGDINSDSIKFAGISQKRNWLKLQGFNILPGLIAPVKDIEKAIERSLSATPFNYSLILGYFISGKESCRYSSLKKRQDSVDSIEVYLDSEGYVRATIQLHQSNSPISVSYHTVLVNQVRVNDIVILDDRNKIITRYPIPSQNPNSSKYVCSFCGRQYVISDEFARCSDVHCLSRMYPAITHFLTSMDLPTLEYPRYVELCQNGSFTKFSDILLLPELRDCEISTTFYDLINSIIPVSAVRNRDSIWKLCTACNNSWESINYYLDHPKSIEVDLKFTSPELVKWLLDKDNVASIREIVQYTNIVIVSESRSFAGPPIFRDKKIWITGKFIHGSRSEIEATLRSYGATLSDYLEADCGVIGDILEEVEGFKVNQLKAKRIPIFSESEFFNRFELDYPCR